MDQTRYTLSEKTESPSGLEVMEGIDTQLDREVTCVRFPVSAGFRAPELDAYKKLCCVNHPNTLEILDIVPGENNFMIVTHRIKGVDAPAWLETYGPVDQRIAHRIAMELLEWMMAWEAVHNAWPHVSPDRIWITEDDDGDLQMKVGRVISPVPEETALNSARTTISILMGNPDDFTGASRGALTRFFDTRKKTGVATISEAHASLEITRPLSPTSEKAAQRFRAGSKGKKKRRFRISKILWPEGRCGTLSSLRS